MAGVGRRSRVEARLSVGLATIAVFGTLLAGVDILMPSTAHAEPDCAVEDQVYDPEKRKIVCRGGGGGDEDGDGGDEPRPEPPDGAERTAERTEVCRGEVPGGGTACVPEDWACDFEAGEDIISYFERDEVYRRAQSSWVPVEGEAGEWRWTRTTCGTPPEERVTENDVWEAVASFGLPGAKPIIQPPNGRTLVNFETNFYVERTEVEPFTLDVGPAQVEVRANATSYTWDFGDGSTPETTSSPGKPHPDLEVTHAYRDTGSFEPSVTITYEVQWRQDGGDWQPLSRPMESGDEPVAELEVVQSKAHLSD